MKDWLFAADRKPGDAAVVETTDSTGNVVGYQVLFLERFGQIRWEYQATNALRSADYTKWYDEVKGNYPAELTEEGKAIPTM